MMAASLGTAAHDVAAMIESHGVEAFVDGEKLRAPCALVLLKSVEPVLGAGTYTATFTVVLVARDHGTTEALDSLGRMLDKLAPLGVDYAEPVTYTSPKHGADLPALQFTLAVQVS